MTRGQFMRVVLIPASVLIVIGVTLMTWMLVTEDDRNVIKVQVDDDMEHIAEFEGIGLVPGESCEYVVKLKGDRSEKYDLKLDFIETKEKTLKNFAHVKIESDGEILYDELLAKCFENDNIVFPIDFSDKKNTELKIVYYLPIDVGNEAKNAEAVFELHITASNE